MSKRIKVKKIDFLLLSRFSILLHFNYTVLLIPVDSYDTQLSFDV